MSAAQLLDVLMAAFATPESVARPEPTPANAAKAANRQQACGLPAHAATCEGLRNAANHRAGEFFADTYSQPFALIRNSANSPERQQPCGFSQNSQLSQGSPGLTPHDLAAVAWMEADIGKFITRRDRLLRWGWTEPDAEKLAERLVQRDREQDDRVNCIDCRHYRPGRCGNHRHAGLGTSEVGRDLASLLQRCPGFE
jgi:hypothetical protein